MNFLSLIEAKRDGKVLSGDQIREAIQSFTNEEIPDYQMAALLMAIYVRGLNDAETRALMEAMRDSGDVLIFPPDPRPLVDKHSTGGIGDKVSLPLVPLLASLGFRVPMISGRGLGITGGTLDKLDSIPGFRTILPTDRIIEIVQTVGCVICGQTADMVPADQKLYALRDVTGTVPSISLVVASILSKKLAGGAKALILDVKYGTGAFMKTKEQAIMLAQAMTSLGNACGTRTRALLSRMDTPLGRAVGNWLEIKETLAFLKNPRAGEENLFTLVVECAAHLLTLTSQTRELSQARVRAEACLDSGEPLTKWNAMLTAQGADLNALERKLNLLWECAVIEIRAEQAGFVKACHAHGIGEAVRALGSGRFTKEDNIDYEVGLDHLVRPGTAVKAGDLLARVYTRSEINSDAAIALIRKSIEISDGPPEIPRLIEAVIDGEIGFVP